MSKQPKTIIVTGASSGIGLAIARAYLERGDNVVGNARSAERLAQAARQLGNPPRFLGVAGDIGHPDTARALFDRATQAFGKVDVLVNNAGIFIAKPLGEYTPDDADALFGTNLKGFFYPSQQAAAHMAAHGGGHIVNITASIALQPQQQVPALLPVLVKGGLNQATQALALELAPHNIRVNAVAPGIIETPMHDGGDTDFLDRLSPSGRRGHTSDVVDAVLYLTDSSFTSGAIVPVDGGARRPIPHRGIRMPYINIQITREGATREQKAELIKGATDLVVRVLGKDPQATFVVIEEVDTDSWGVGGETVTALRQRQRAAPST